MIRPLRFPLPFSRLRTHQEPPVDWVDPSTGHRVIRLSRSPGSKNLYFHQNAFPPQGDKLIFQEQQRLCILDLSSREIGTVIQGPISHPVVGRKNREVYYLADNTIHATHLDSTKTRVIAEIPADWTWGSGLTVNADETLLAGTTTEVGQKFTQTMNRKKWFNAIFEAQSKTLIYTVNLETGRVKVPHRSRGWFNHIQFSPVDPACIMYCQEGPWHKLDRIWVIHLNGGTPRKIHERTMEMEIVGHEFWNPDGNIIWYDQQTPKGEKFFLGGTVLATGEKLRYSIDRDRWSVHYNVSIDGLLLAGDGSAPSMTAKARDGKWIYLYHKQRDELQWERLANLTCHDYKLEPNVAFTPDGKWVVFCSNMHGAEHIYAVEVARNQ